MKFLIDQFEDGTLDIKEFDHRKHLYIAWTYLKDMPFDVALDRYSKYLYRLLDINGQLHRFSPAITEKHMSRLSVVMSFYPTDSFDMVMYRLDLR